MIMRHDRLASRVIVASIALAVCAVPASVSAWSSSNEIIVTEPLNGNPGWTLEGEWAFGPPQGARGQYAASVPAARMEGAKETKAVMAQVQAL